MEAYRDQYATLFNNGRKVVVLGVSADPDTMLANWAKETSYPGLYASDSTKQVANLYGSARARSVFIVGPDGRITHRIASFNVLSQDAYADLEKAVDSVAGAPRGASPP
jgi:peroxiredoxin